MIKRMISPIGALAIALVVTLGASPVFAQDAKKNDEETYRLLALLGMCLNVFALNTWNHPAKRK